MKTTNIFYRALCLMMMTLCSMCVKGQTEYITVPDVIPPSPTVSALCKYGQIPVDYSTGIPDITIPLYTLKCGSLELPITLTYHAGGIKVDEAASWVGLGWSLNAGGTIGVTVNGKADKLLFPYDIPTFSQLRDKEFGGVYNQWDLDDWYEGYDLNPDLYSYSVAGQNGQFMYDWKEKTYYDLNGNKGIHIERVGQSTEYHFRIFDNKGNLYLFDEQERAERYSLTTGNTDVFYTAWNPSKLLSASGQDSITFAYSSLLLEADRAQYAPSRFLGLDEKEDWMTGIVSMNMNSGVTLGFRPIVNHVWTTYYTNKITSIKGSNGIEVVLETEGGRLDMPTVSSSSPCRLKAITVKDPSGKQLKKWEFVHGYFASYITNPKESSTAYRLKLMELLEYGADDAVANRYSFAYYGERDGEPQMPYRYSFAGKDAWGYCNGKPTLAEVQDSLKAFPNFESIYFNMYKSINDIVRYNKELMVSNTTGEDKSANPSYTHAYSLRRITYPTGGYTEFAYEPNHFECTDNFSNPYEWQYNTVSANGAGIRIKEITDYDGKKASKRTFTYSEGELLVMPHFIQRKIYQTNSHVPGVTASEETYNDEIKTYMEMHSSPTNTLSVSSGGCVAYTKVTEHFPEGSIVYEYSPLYKWGGDEYDEYGEFALYHNYTIVSACTDEVVDYVNNGTVFYMDEMCTEHTDDRYNSYQGWYGTFFNRSLLVGKSVYDHTGRILSEESNTYSYKELHKIPGAEIQQSPTLKYLSIVNTGQNEETYFINYYWHMTGLSQLKKKTVTEYAYPDEENSAQIMTTTTEYTYNDDNLLTGTVTTDSSGDEVSTLIRYPSDITASAVCQGMIEKNMLDYPIEVVEKHNGKTVSSQLVCYGTFNGSYHPSAYYSYRPAMPDSNFSLYTGSVQSEYGTADVTITDYLHGRIASMKDKDNVSTNYLWGYSWEYPIAQIRGIPYSQVTSSLNPSTYGAMTTVTTSTLSALRSLFGTAHVSCYTYLPGTGLEVIQGTDKSIQKFGYDGLGRLNGLYTGSDPVNANLREKYTYHTINE